MAFSLSKRALLCIAFLVWLFAGAMLFYKALCMSDPSEGLFVLKLIVSLLGGLLFFLILFRKISSKHIRRILGLKGDKQFFLAFFNLRSYFMMGLMITLGVFLRRSHLIPASYLFPVYVTMAIPLLLSSLRFLRAFLRFSAEK